MAELSNLRAAVIASDGFEALVEWGEGRVDKLSTIS